MRINGNRFFIETERLLLLPLTAEESRLYATGGEALAKELGVAYGGDDVDSGFASILAASAKLMECEDFVFPYQAFWVIITKDTGTIIGSSDFKTKPDSNGVTEIGYGLCEQFTHHGYMAECVCAMCKWAFATGDVSEVIAETDCDNVASINVLKRCGFKQIESLNKYYRWSLKNNVIQNIIR